MSEATPVMELPRAARPRRFRTLRTIWALMLREMSATYGRSPGGYVWAILEPVGAIAMFTLVLSVGLKIRHPGIGSNFPLFYATGWLPYALFMQTSNKVARSITFSRQLLRYPAVTYIDAIASRFLLNLVTHLIVAYIIMAGIHIAFGLRLYLDPVPALAAICLAAVLGLGVGAMNCWLFHVVPIWDSLWSILTRPLFLLSTIIYTFEQVPRDWQWLVWFNPIVHFVGLMRRAFYPTYDAAWASPLYVLGFGMIPLAFGLVMLSRSHRDIIDAN